MNIDEALAFADRGANPLWNERDVFKVLADEVRRLRGQIIDYKAHQFSYGDMKLFRFDPKGHGPYSFFVVAESKLDAIELTASFIHDKKNNFYPQGYEGFFEGKYETTEIPFFVVTAHEND